MAAKMEPCLDEIMWSSPGWVQMNNGIHENSVLFYFAESPFFDHTSNNAAIFTQAMYNPDMHQYLASRENFEEQLRTMQGLEYVVHVSARDFGPEAPIQQGVWVIRKQNRRKRAGYPDGITILGTYYVVGDHIYMAPSVANIIQARLLSTTLALSKVVSTAAALPYYTPALGHRYFQPVPTKAREATSLPQTAQPSREATPMPEREQSVAPDTTTKAPGSNATSSTINVADSQALYESFGQFLRFGKEYMDENPLVGEPGNFVFTSSKQHLQAQQDLAAKKAAQHALPKVQVNTKAAPTPERTRPPTPTAKPDGPKRAKTMDKTGEIRKPKRRKSKAPKSPGSPASPVSAI